MKSLRTLLIAAAILNTTPLSQAETMGCPGKIIRAEIEFGELKPYPELLKPEVKGSGKSRRLEWNSLNEKESATPFYANCYKSSDSDQRTRVVVPFRFKRCVLEKESFTCYEAPAAKKTAAAPAKKKK